MKKVLCILFSVGMMASLNAQEKNEKLYYLVKIWGVIKYYHPVVAKSNVNWNDIFMREANSIFNDDQVTLSKITTSLLDAATRPAIPVSKNRRYSSYKDQPYSNLDFEWLKDPALRIDEKERTYLYQMVTNYTPQKNSYINDEINKYYLSTPIEKFWYPSNNLPDKAQALLALAQYWNVINYFDPHQENFTAPWDTVLKNFIPEILNKAGKNEFYLAFASLTTKINDSHAFYYNYEFDSLIGLHEPAILVRLIDRKHVAVTNISDSLKKITSISPGDILTKLNGQDINIRRKEIAKYFGGSHQGSIDREIDGALLRGNFGQKYEIEFQDKQGAVHTAQFILTKNLAFNSQLLRRKDHVQTFPELKTMYVRLGGTNKKSLNKAINEAAKNADHLILDFRFGGQLTNWNRLLGKFTNKRVTVAKYYDCSFTYPGYFKPSVIKKKSAFSFLSKKYSKKVVVLVNENVQSSMEFNLMMLKAAIPGLKIIGRNTAGADGAAASLLVQQNLLTYFTRDVVLFPDNRKTQGVGIIPDLYVNEDIDMLRKGKDAILEKTLAFINTNQ